ncbi:MAG: tetratricopeptide repeat protein, partial [Myxococcota bacterium]
MGIALVLALAGIAILVTGVLLGRYYLPDDRPLRQQAERAQAYVSALNQVLGKQRDEAITTLKDVVERNTDDLEPYYALAALFRDSPDWDARDWERAIRVHQSIALRQHGSRDKRAAIRVLYELGLDYRSAGMPRRATRAMEEVLDLDRRHQRAMVALCGLYEEQGRYSEAAAIWRRL